MAKPQLIGGGVRTVCPDCGGALAVYNRRSPNREFGFVIREGRHEYMGGHFTRVLFVLMCCGGCGRGGLATIHELDGRNTTLEAFYPSGVERAPLPGRTPGSIVSEYREAELCASIGALRAASALLRSTLEKTLRANGYVDGSLQEKIDQAANDGILTAARRKRAHEQIRDLGNDILHDEWREVTEGEYTSSHHYAQRILEDFYDDRAGVEALLFKAKRLKPADPEAARGEAPQ